MPRRLVLLFDGTWSKAQTHTNVERLRQLIAARDVAGNPQLCQYVKGVGVASGIKHLLGGAFGWGLSDNVKQGYGWLSERWQPDDEIWLFGFSRGAYTARSLGGLIRKCGLLRQDAAGTVTTAAIKSAYAMYRNNLHPDHELMREFRRRHAHEVGIRGIGVWDTVGALGIPGVGSWFPFSHRDYAFHDTDLSKIVQYAWQALALDERRADYAPTKWTRPRESLAAGATTRDWKPSQLEVEQRWFIGAHADVGGGERSDGAGRAPDPLPDLPLAWMQAKAADAGLAFEHRFIPAAQADLAQPNDSYRHFMYGIYKWFKRPLPRPLGGGVNETIDPTVWAKWHAQASYRPAALLDAIRYGRVQENDSRID